MVKQKDTCVIFIMWFLKHNDGMRTKLNDGISMQLKRHV